MFLLNYFSYNKPYTKIPAKCINRNSNHLIKVFVLWRQMYIYLFNSPSKTLFLLLLLQKSSAKLTFIYQITHNYYHIYTFLPIYTQFVFLFFAHKLINYYLCPKLTIKSLNVNCYSNHIIRLFCVLTIFYFKTNDKLYAQSIQKGFVMEYHEKSQKTPLSNVSVSATNAASTATDNRGGFTLNFRSLKPGDNIQFRRIEKPGYEVMNREAIEVMRIGSQNNSEPLNIILCSTKLLNELRDGYRSVAVKRYEKELKQAENEAKRLKDEGRLKEDEYNQRLDDIEAEYELKLSDIDNYVDRFARIDLSELDEIEQRIIALVKEGKFEEAMKLYEEQGFVEKLKKSRAELQQLSNAKQTLETAINDKEDEESRLRQSIERQITLLRMAGGKDNLDKAHEILRNVFLADESNIEARKDYAHSLYQRDEKKEACKLLEDGIENTEDDLSKSLLAIDLVDYYDLMEEKEEAMKYALMADNLSSQSKDKEYIVNARIMPATTKYILYNSLENKEESQKIIDRIKADWAPDSLNILSLGNYSQLLYVMYYYYSLNNNMEQTTKVIYDALALNKILQQKAPWMSSLGTWYSSACQNDKFIGQYDKAKENAIKAIDITEEALEKTPLSTLTVEYINIYYTSLDILTDIGEYTEAEKVMQKIIDRNMPELATSAGNDDLTEMAGLCYMISSLHALNKGNADEAEKLVNKGYAIMSSIAESVNAEPQKHIYMARIRQYQHKYEEAKNEYEKAIAIARQQYEEEPDAWNADTYCCFMVLYADMLGETGKKNECKKMLKSAEKIASFECDKLKVNEIKKKYNIK